MKITMEQWEIERVKSIISDILHLWAYPFIEANNESGDSISMSKETFFESLERELKG